MAIAFAGAFGLHRAGDDWLAAAFAMEAIETGEPYAQIARPFTHHWSPLWYAMEIANYQVAGWQSDTFIRLFVIAWAAIGLAVFVWLTRALGLGRPAIVFGVAVLALHPIAAAAYYSFDCYSQVAADTLVWGITAILIGVGIGTLTPRAAIGAVLLFVPAILFKEQALAAVINAVIVAAWFRQRTLALAAAALIVGSALFTLARWRAGLWFDADGPFALCFSCVPANVATLIGGSLLPVPTSEVYLAVRGREWSNPWLATGVIAALGAAAFLAVGAARWRARRSHAALIVALVVAATFPVMLLSDIGELYSHALLFWIALAAAVAWHTLSPPPLVGAIVASVLAAGLLVNLSEMRETGRRAAALLASAREALAPLPEHAQVVLEGFDDVAGPRDYSLMRISTPGRLLLYGVALEVALERPITLVDEADAPDRTRHLGGARHVLRCVSAPHASCVAQILTAR